MDLLEPNEGFDHRSAYKWMRRFFRIVKEAGTPLPVLGGGENPATVKALCSNWLRLVYTEGYHQKHCHNRTKSAHFL